MALGWAAVESSPEFAVLALVYFPLQLVAVLDAKMLFNLHLDVALSMLSLMTVWCTEMIYASLKTIPQWHSPLTSVNYLLFR